MLQGVFRSVCGFLMIRIRSSEEVLRLKPLGAISFNLRHFKIGGEPFPNQCSGVSNCDDGNKNEQLVDQCLPESQLRSRVLASGCESS